MTAARDTRLVMLSVDAAGEREEARGTAAEFLADNDDDPAVADAIEAVLGGAEFADVGGGAGALFRLRLEPTAGAT